MYGTVSIKEHCNLQAFFPIVALLMSIQAGSKPFKTLVNDPTCHLERQLERAIDYFSNAIAGFECIGDTWTRQKREDLGFEHRLSGVYKEIVLRFPGSLYVLPKGS
jgi:hypothetical protein